mgnify:CR=1 FL=1
MALFEIGPVFYQATEGELPHELSRLAIAMTGPRSLSSWDSEDSSAMDFFDLKGTLSELFRGLRIKGLQFEPGDSPIYHSGKCVLVSVNGQALGYMGELHPLVRERYDLPETPVIAAELDLAKILESIPGKYEVRPVPAYPPVLEDFAIIVDENIPAERVLEVVKEAGGSTLVDVRLFDVYRGEQIGEGKKSLAYSLSYQAPDRTLTDEEVAKIRKRIVKHLDSELDAKLRS